MPARLVVATPGQRLPRLFSAMALALAWAKPGVAVTRPPADPRVEAAASAQVAAQDAREKRYDACAQGYDRAARLEPGMSRYRYDAARCAEEAGHRAQAYGWYESFLRAAPPGDPLRTRARRRMAGLGIKRKRPDAGWLPTGPSRPGWLTVLAGGAVMALGLGISASTFTSRSALDDRMQPRKGDRLIRDISYAAATARAEEIDRTGRVGFSVISLGAVICVTGTWLVLWSHQDSVTLVPAGPGARLTVRW